MTARGRNRRGQGEGGRRRGSLRRRGPRGPRPGDRTVRVQGRPGDRAHRPRQPRQERLEQRRPAADALRVSPRPRAATVHIAGPLGYAADSGKAFKGIDGTLLDAALAVVIILLLITYRSPTLWLLPGISAGVALITAQAVIYLLAAHAGLTVNAQSAGILDVLVFGAGTDYALLLTARYREELRRHEDRHAAMAVALRRAGLPSSPAPAR